MILMHAWADFKLYYLFSSVFLTQICRLEGRIFTRPLNHTVLGVGVITGADPLYCGKGEARRSSTHQGFVHEVRKKKTKLSGKQAPSALRKAHTDKVPKPGRRRLLYHAAGRELACMEEFHRMNLAVLKS